MSAREPSSLLSFVHPAVQRTAVVLLHGLCSTPDELLTVQSALRDGGYAVHPMSIPGYSFDANAPMQQAAPFQQWLDSTDIPQKLFFSFSTTTNSGPGPGRWRNHFFFRSNNN